MINIDLCLRLYLSVSATQSHWRWAKEARACSRPVTDTFMLPCDLICGHKRVDMIIIQTSKAQIQVDVCALVKGIPVVSYT